MALSKHWPIEIINMDSALVYRGMDIGTAKPSLADRAKVAHHLIDILEPTQVYSAAAFAEQTRTLVRTILARGRLPLLVGGTLLYLKAWLHGFADLPSAQPELRQEIEAQALRLGWPAMHAQLALVDPVTAARLSVRDGQRIGRALEVWRFTGRTLSSFFNDQERPDTGSWPSIISLEPDQRCWLHQRIAQRFEQMLELGLVNEVRSLRQRSDLNAGLPAMRCVGYRQTWQLLDEVERMQRCWQPSDTEKLLQTGSAATRQLAKRQLTWLRSMPERVPIACDRSGWINQVLLLAQRAWD